MQDCWREQRGAAMILTAVSLMTLLLLTGLALDYGRAHLLRAQLQTALDAAALAGALQSEPWVKVTVLRREWFQVQDQCWDPENGVWYGCGWHWESRSADSCCLTGKEIDLVYREAWRQQVACGWPYDCLGTRIEESWIVLGDSALDWARDAFARNAAWPRGPGGVTLREFWVGPDPGGQARVAARAVLALPTGFLRLAAVSEIRVARTAAAEPVRRR